MLGRKQPAMVAYWKRKDVEPAERKLKDSSRVNRAIYTKSESHLSLAESNRQKNHQQQQEPTSLPPAATPSTPTGPVQAL